VTVDHCREAAIVGLASDIVAADRMFHFAFDRAIVGRRDAEWMRLGVGSLNLLTHFVYASSTTLIGLSSRHRG
jgi:hypothetical protein